MLQTSIALCLQKISLVIWTLQHYMPPLLLLSLCMKVRVKSTICALASSVLPKGIDFCSRWTGLHLVLVLLLLLGSLKVHIICLVIVNLQKIKLSYCAVSDFSFSFCTS